MAKTNLNIRSFLDSRFFCWTFDLYGTLKNESNIKQKLQTLLPWRNSASSRRRSSSSSPGLGRFIICELTTFSNFRDLTIFCREQCNGEKKFIKHNNLFVKLCKLFLDNTTSFRGSNSENKILRIVSYENKRKITYFELSCSASKRKPKPEVEASFDSRFLGCVGLKVLMILVLKEWHRRFSLKKASLPNLLRARWMLFIIVKYRRGHYRRRLEWALVKSQPKKTVLSQWFNNTYSVVWWGQDYHP